MVGRGPYFFLYAFKTPPSGGVMSDEDDADFAFSRLEEFVNIKDYYIQRLVKLKLFFIMCYFSKSYLS